MEEREPYKVQTSAEDVIKILDNAPKISREEVTVLNKIRNTDYGEVIVKIKAGKPVLVTESKTTRLD